MVYGTGNQYSCRASPRQGEHRSRLGVTTPARLQQLEIETPDFSGSRESAWTILHRPFCIKDLCSTRVILQLEARPICCSGGCSDDPVDEALPLPIPPIRIDLQMPRQDQKGTDVGSPHSSPLAESGVVPTSPPISSGPPNPAATNPRHSDESKWKEPPSILQGHLPLAAWPISGKHSDLRDFRKELLKYSKGLGEHQHNQFIQVLGDSGIVGVLNGVLIPSRPL